MDLLNDNLLDIIEKEDADPNDKQLALLMMIRNNLISIKHWLTLFGIVFIFTLVITLLRGLIGL